MAMEEKAARGQTIRTETSPNRNAPGVNMNEALAGRKMAGAPDDISSSISGSKVATYNDDAAKSRK